MPKPLIFGKRLKVEVDEALFESVKTAARRVGVTQSEWLRRTLLSASSVEAENAVVGQLDGLDESLRKIGTRVARHADRTEGLYALLKSIEGASVEREAEREGRLERNLEVLGDRLARIIEHSEEIEKRVHGLRILTASLVLSGGNEAVRSLRQAWKSDEQLSAVLKAFVEGGA